MKKIFAPLAFCAVLLLVGLLVFPTTVWAHQNVTVGDYTVEYGWVNEPAIVGQANAVVVNITPTNADPAKPVDVDASGLQVQAAYGGQTKALTLQPLGEDTPGQFVAPITPMRAGKYTVHFSGKIGTTTFNNDVQPEEVQTADLVQFPTLENAQAGSSSSLPIILGVAGILLGAAGLVLGAIALIRKPAK